MRCGAQALPPSRIRQPAVQNLQRPPLQPITHTLCRKKADHVNAITREVEVMRRLRGSLNMASLEEVRSLPGGGSGARVAGATGGRGSRAAHRQSGRLPALGSRPRGV